jgi:hypothetical protein
MESLLYIQLSEYLGLAQSFKDFLNQWQEILILLCQCVQFPVVHVEL